MKKCVGPFAKGPFAKGPLANEALAHAFGKKRPILSRTRRDRYICESEAL